MSTDYEIVLSYFPEYVAGTSIVEPILKSTKCESCGWLEAEADTSFCRRCIESKAALSYCIEKGLNRARVLGKRLGRPPLTSIEVGLICSVYQEVRSMKRVAKLLGFGVSTVHKYIHKIQFSL